MRKAQDQTALRWIKGELDETLQQARGVLQEYAEGGGDRALLGVCNDKLHQIRAILQMIQLYGPAMLAEEMEQVSQAMFDNRVGDPEEAAAALMMALIQLPDYLEKLQAGAQDIPLVVLPLLNDLRATRDAPLLSEAALFAPVLDESLLPRQITGEVSAELAQVARRSRRDYHKGLLGWYTNTRTAQSLQRLRQVIEELQRYAGTQPLFELFWAAHALTAGLSEGSLTTGSAIKSLYGKLDREIKRVIDSGEAQVARDPNRELLKNILYYVARADSEDSVVKSVQQAYHLGSALPSEREIADGRARLQAPNADALDTVREVIKSDLTWIKDSLDLYIRSDRSQNDPLAALETPLRKLADTLGMLGQGGARVRLNRQADHVKAMTGADQTPGDEALMEIAADLLFVETSLANVGQADTLELSDPNDLSAAGAGSLLLPSGELDKLVGATLQEARIDLGKIKEAIIASIEGEDIPDALSGVGSKFRNIVGALRMLSLTEPAEMLEAIGGYVDNEMRIGGRLPEQARLTALADAIIASECFIESALEGDSHREDLLFATRNALQRLGLEVGARAEQSRPALTLVENAAGLEAVDQEAVDEEAQSDRRPETGFTEEPLQSMPESASAQPKEPEQAAFADEIDPEIREIFLDEAREELATIQQLAPRWMDNPQDQESLKRFRRSFHTLKGSGRLVGANGIGELSWSIENMLNRLLDGSIGVSPELRTVLGQALGLLPQLVEQLQLGVQSVAGVQELMDRAHAVAESKPLSEGVVAAAGVPSEPKPGPEEPEAQEGEPVSGDREPSVGIAADEMPAPPRVAVSMDPELLGIFDEESQSHLKVVDEVIQQFWEQQQPLPISETLIRALHTLRGSANMADALPIADVAKGLEKLVGAMAEVSAQADAPVVALLEEGVAKIREQLAVINVPDVHFPGGDELVARADALRERKLAGATEPAASEAGGLGSGEDDGATQTLTELEFESTSDDLAREQSAEPTGEGQPQGAEADEKTAFAQPVAETRGVAAEPAEEPLEEAEEGVDSDLVEIFLEEARDLCEQLDVGLQRWRQDKDQKAPLEALQRTLHTLKGGARLAGITPVGDLSHTLESLLIGIAADHLVVSDDLQSLAQQAIDRLSAQVDEVAACGAAQPAQQLIAELDARLNPEAEPAKRSGEEGVDELPMQDTHGAVPTTEAVQAEGENREVQEPVQPPERSEAATRAGSGESRSVDAEPAGAVVTGTAAGSRSAALPRPTREPESKLPPKREQIKVRSDLLDRLVNNAGEVSIYRARMEQQNSSIGFHLSELEQTVTRLRQQLRQMELENEAQILFRYEREKEERVPGEAQFDPLELDRFSNMQQLSRSLMETVSDLVSIKDITEELHREMETLLMQQARVSTDLQDGLLRTRMVPFGQVVSRLQRLVRQTCTSMNKRARLVVEGAQVEVDRNILERMVAPLEHILRNAVSHGIEAPEAREAQGKAEQGQISLALSREGTDVVLTIADDGQGLNLDSIRRRAIDKGLLSEQARVTDSDVMQFVLEPGFSTAAEVTQIAGRGVGMDVVSSEVKQIGGALEIASEPGRGSCFTIRLPLTLAISEALLVQMDEDVYAVPHTSIEGVVRISRDELQNCYEARQEGFEYAGHMYLVRYLGSLLGIGAISLPEGKKWLHMLLVRSGERRVALQVDGLLGNRQIVVKSVGPQLSSVRWITGGTILGDGRVALILDVNALVRMDAAKPLAATDNRPSLVTGKEGVKVMVVDDSITVRKVTGRLLERHNFQVITAKDGVDAVAQLQEQLPDVMLLDIEMPRMDGFELARHMQNSPDLKHIPIIMITSRTGAKHRNLANALGVKRYLGKPYQEMDLLDNIYSILAEAQA